MSVFSLYYSWSSNSFLKGPFEEKHFDSTIEPLNQNGPQKASLERKQEQWQKKDLDPNPTTLGIHHLCEAMGVTQAT